MSLMLLVASLATAAAVGVLLIRWDVWRWLAVLVALVPLVPLLDLGGAADSGGDPARVAVLMTLTSLGLVLLGWRAASTSVLATGGVLLVGLGALVGSGLGDGVTLNAPSIVGLLLAAVVAGAAAAGLGRSRSGALRRTCAMVATVPLGTVLACWALGPEGAGPTMMQSWPMVAWLPAAAALGVTALVRGRRSTLTGRPQYDAVDWEAVNDFDHRYDHPELARVVIVIAAYNEARGVRGVLESLPRTVCGLAADVVVVDDGSSDETAARVQEADRAYLVTCARNRGQGAALRLGYRVAREHGAEYLITTDADGQYDAADLPVVLAPVLEGRADFVTGSRLLGLQQTHDRVRRLGVHVFAWCVSALVGRRITDTSFGLRAMRVEVTASVTLRQPQYQSSELLIGAISHGFEVLEVPASMWVRSAGSSKKGTNLVYGCSYARVVLGTWWREGCPAPVTERAASLRDSRGAPQARPDLAEVASDAIR